MYIEISHQNHFLFQYQVVNCCRECSNCSTVSIVLDCCDVTTSCIVSALEDLKQQMSKSLSENYDTMSDGTRGSETENAQAPK